MRCDDIRDRLDELWDGQAAGEVRQHLAQWPPVSHTIATCAWCARVQPVEAEEAPEPSLGFAERLVRQMGELSKSPSVADFFERVGRRFVYAALVAHFSGAAGPGRCPPPGPSGV